MNTFLSNKCAEAIETTLHLGMKNKEYGVVQEMATLMS